MGAQKVSLSVNGSLIRPTGHAEQGLTVTYREGHNVGVVKRIAED